jgi:hypothetical protein
MIEVTENTNQLQVENHQSELEHNYLSYELPQLRKHGKVNDRTTTVFASGPSFDNFFGPGFANS